MLRKFAFKIVRIPFFIINVFAKLYKHYGTLFYVIDDLNNLFWS